MSTIEYYKTCCYGY